MKPEDCKATDLLLTGKMAQNAGHHVYDYFNRVYVKEILEKDKTFKSSYEELRKIDTDGLFLPIFINEIDKYASRIYGSGITDEATKTIGAFKEYLLKIIKKKHDEDVELDFIRDGISIHIELAVGDYTTSKKIESVICRLESLVNSRKVNTIYIIASGDKMHSANEIATGLEEKVVQDIYEPRYTQYKRYTRRLEGKDSICYEINVRY